MQVIKLHLPKRLIVNLHRMSRRLPKPSFPIFAGLGAEEVPKTLRAMVVGIVSETSAGKLAKIRECRFQRFGLEGIVKDDGMQMSGHDDVGVDAQAFFVMTEGEAFGNDAASEFANEQVKPIDDGKSDVEKGAVGVEAIAFHGQSVRDTRRNR